MDYAIVFVSDMPRSIAFYQDTFGLLLKCMVRLVAGRKEHFMRVNYAIVFVSDMSRSIAFYQETLGLQLKFETPMWTEFATDGATLALHTSESDAAADDPHEDLPPGRCRPGLSVGDLDAFHQRMIERGVPCTQLPRDVFGTRLAQYLDPDGLAISVAEASDDRQAS